MSEKYNYFEVIAALYDGMFGYCEMGFGEAVALSAGDFHLVEDMPSNLVPILQMYNVDFAIGEPITLAMIEGYRESLELLQEDDMQWLNEEELQHFIMTIKKINAYLEEYFERQVALQKAKWLSSLLPNKELVSMKKAIDEIKMLSANFSDTYESSASNEVAGFNFFRSIAQFYISIFDFVKEGNSIEIAFEKALANAWRFPEMEHRLSNTVVYTYYLESSSHALNVPTPKQIETYKTQLALIKDDDLTQYLNEEEQERFDEIIKNMDWRIAYHKDKNA